MIVKESKKFGSLSEAGHGSREVKIAYLDPDTGEIITPFCKCKDYFNDMFFSNSANASVHIFGFKWDPKEDKGILEKPKLMIAIKTTDHTKGDVPVSESEALSIESLVSKFTRTLKFKKCKFEFSEDKKHFIITFDRSWTDIPYLNSSFYLLIRLGFTYDDSKDFIEQFKESKGKFISSNDQMYLRNVKVQQRFSDMLEGKIDKNQTYKMYTVSDIHNRSGIVGYVEYKV